MGRFQSAVAAAAAAVVAVSLLLSLACDGAAAVSGDPSSSPSLVKLKQQQQQQPAAHVRELLGACEDDVKIIQSEVPPGPDPEPEPAPRFKVTILNTSSPARRLYNVSVTCDGFDDASVVPIPFPEEFKRISQSECILKDGGDFLASTPIVFDYLSSSEYTFRVASASC